MHRGRLVAFVLGLLAGCPGATTDTSPVCDADAEVQGRASFRDARAQRTSDEQLDLALTFLDLHGERLNTAPTIDTDVGVVTDALADGATARVRVLPASRGPVRGAVVLRGALAGHFRDDVDRCPFQVTLFLSQVEGGVLVDLR